MWDVDVVLLDELNKVVEQQGVVEGHLVGLTLELLHIVEVGVSCVITRLGGCTTPKHRAPSAPTTRTFTTTLGREPTFIVEKSLTVT